MGWIQMLLGGLVIIFSICSLFNLQEKLESAVQQIEKDKEALHTTNITKFEYRKYLEEKVIRPLYTAQISLRLIRLPKAEGIHNSMMKEEPLINTFVIEESRKYITPKESRTGQISMYGIERIYNTTGHAFVLYKKELEEYMSYDIGSYCNDDWNSAKKLMLNGCDPLPRRRCLTRASMVYQKPYPINESLWKLLDDRNVRWSNYYCRNFECLMENNTKRGYSKCVGCFEMEKEKLKWVTNSSLTVDFRISDVLAIKPGEMRIGLDFGIGTGTFAARMREHNVTVVSTALNLRGPFNEMIALRGLLLDFILFDWDRILRPGGLLWIDRFFCVRKGLDDFMYMFLQLRYKQHKGAISPKSKDEVYFSALLEKPPRAIWLLTYMFVLRNQEAFCFLFAVRGFVILTLVF
ncbi:hypothetical protein D8674_007707 [Pyrus ussuriensis x Pyrus communis]|uniref:Methyltransferase n=1 Tax=Pyrus ussuriensis x Pyrus communis TaxID=2448454 RepID=A0A5N5HRG5_9ROSA|nr:hypothetical protein D8674_007707 [Pyrus ussuriensis x Pyrus communis]